MPRNPQFEGSVHAPEFPRDSVWLNTAKPISIRELEGKIVLLDFWTYCCINCLHVLPELKTLERKYREELVVLGVHAGKFTTEKETASIASAIDRYEIEHPVINDHNFQVWQSCGIRAWPSFTLNNPVGRIVGTHSGEGIYKLFDTMIADLIEYFDTDCRLARSSRPTSSPPALTTTLRFLGKVEADTESGHLYVSDTGHHRILITDQEGRILDQVGSGEPGMTDGAFETSSLQHP
tara:strand:- start:210 stop:917 length:708 start_codon:yes stop_codon:yes gene_type:complete